MTILDDHSRKEGLEGAGELRSIEPIDIPFLQDPGASVATRS